MGSAGATISPGAPGSAGAGFSATTAPCCTLKVEMLEVPSGIGGS